MYSAFQKGVTVEFRVVYTDRNLHGDDPRGVLVVFNKYTVLDVTQRPWCDFISLVGVDGIFDSAWFEVVDDVSENANTKPSHRWENVHKSILNTLGGMKAEVNTLLENFGTNFDELIATGKMTVDDIKNRIPETEEAFKEFTGVLEKVKHDTLELMRFYSLDEKTRLELEKKAELDEAIQIARRANERVSTLHGELQSICTCTDTRIEHDYRRGGYLNQDMSITRKVCSVCDRIIEEKSEPDGFS